MESAKTYSITLLCILVLAFYSNFIFLTGNYKTFFYNSLIVALVCFFLHYRILLSIIRKKEVACFVVLSMVPLLLGFFPSESMVSTKRYLQNISYFIVLCVTIIFCIKVLPHKWRSRVFSVILALFFSGIAFHLYGVLEVNSRQGFYSNSHYLALFCLMSFPVISYGLLANRSKVSTGIWAVSTCVIFFLLMNTLSRPAWIALFVGYGVGVCLFLGGWQRAGSIIFMVFTVVMGYLFLPDFVIDRVDDLAKNFLTEERFAIWQSAFQMQLSSEYLSWIFGHGPGSYKVLFEELNAYYSFFYFPHNFFIEILFESGIVGLAVISFLYFKVYALLLFVYNHEPGKRFLFFTLFVCLTTHLLFTFFTVPFYSKYVTLTQAPIIALILYYYDETRAKIIS